MRCVPSRSSRSMAPRLVSPSTPARPSPCSRASSTTSTWCWSCRSTPALAASRSSSAPIASSVRCAPVRRARRLTRSSRWTVASRRQRRARRACWCKRAGCGQLGLQGGRPRRGHRRHPRAGSRGLRKGLLDGPSFTSTSTTPPRRRLPRRALRGRGAYEQAPYAGANPNSLHTMGRQAARALDAARTDLARCLGGRYRPQDVVFTSGGTESNNLALLGLAEGMRDRDRKRTKVVLSAIEHDSVLDVAPCLRAGASR